MGSLKKILSPRCVGHMPNRKKKNSAGGPQRLRGPRGRRRARRVPGLAPRLRGAGGRVLGVPAPVSFSFENYKIYHKHFAPVQAQRFSYINNFDWFIVRNCFVNITFFSATSVFLIFVVDIILFSRDFTSSRNSYCQDRRSTP